MASSVARKLRIVYEELLEVAKQAVGAWPSGLSCKWPVMKKGKLRGLWWYAVQMAA